MAPQDCAVLLFIERVKANKIGRATSSKSNEITSPLKVFDKELHPSLYEGLTKRKRQHPLGLWGHIAA